MSTIVKRVSLVFEDYRGCQHVSLTIMLISAFIESTIVSEAYGNKNTTAVPYCAGMRSCQVVDQTEANTPLLFAVFSLVQLIMISIMGHYSSHDPPSVVIS